MISSLSIRRIANISCRRTVKSIFQATSSTTNSATVCSANFSTKPQEEDVLFIPPNLKIDSRTSASPFAGLDIISEEKESEPFEADEASEELSIDEVDDLDDLEDDDEEEDDEEGTYYSLDKMPAPQYVTPLPVRLHVPILDFQSATESGTIHLSSDAFGQDPIRTDILHRCVIYHRNKLRGKRNGGARTKTIGEVSGSGKKVRNQKGGGIARAGHKRPAHWRGGAKAHGPKGSIQNYETKLNKKVRKMGLRMALSQKLKEGNLILVNGFSDVGTYKTKILAQTLSDLAGIGGKSGISGYFVDHIEEDDNEGIDGDGEEALITSLEGCEINLKVAASNIQRVKVTNQRNVNVYDLLKHEKVVMSLSALEQLEKRYEY